MPDLEPRIDGPKNVELLSGRGLRIPPYATLTKWTIAPKGTIGFSDSLKNQITAIAKAYGFDVYPDGDELMMVRDHDFIVKQRNEDRNFENALSALADECYHEGTTADIHCENELGDLEVFHHRGELRRPLQAADPVKKRAATIRNQLSGELTDLPLHKPKRMGADDVLELVVKIQRGRVEMSDALKQAFEQWAAELDADPDVTSTKDRMLELAIYLGDYFKIHPEEMRTLKAKGIYGRKVDLAKMLPTVDWTAVIDELEERL